MCLQSWLMERFLSWQPRPPEVLARSRYDLTLDCSQELFPFLRGDLLYRLEKNHKLPKWVIVYSGGKTIKRIDNLAPSHPHRFRLKVILKATAVPTLAAQALKYYGSEEAVHLALARSDSDDENDDKIDKDAVNKGRDNIKNKSVDAFVNSTMINDQIDGDNIKQIQNGESYSKQNDDTVSISVIGDHKASNKCKEIDVHAGGDAGVRITVTDDHVRNEVDEQIKTRDKKTVSQEKINKPSMFEGSHQDPVGWLESQYSSETWTSTECDGSSARCFCMAVSFGEHQQIQEMLEERPELIGLVNPSTGLTPLATAIMKGDATTVSLLLSLGADPEQASGAGRTPLMLAALHGRLDVLDLLLPADLQARDWNGMRVAHCAVDSGNVAVLRRVADAGADLDATDSNGWTPLFRAVIQGACTEMVAELIARGGDLDAVDRAGLPLSAAARLLKDRHGRRRESILRLVDRDFPAEAARAHFTRITRKLSHLHALFRRPPAPTPAPTNVQSTPLSDIPQSTKMTIDTAAAVSQLVSSMMSQVASMSGNTIPNATQSQSADDTSQETSTSVLPTTSITSTIPEPTIVTQEPSTNVSMSDTAPSLSMPASTEPISAIPGISEGLPSMEPESANTQGTNTILPPVTVSTVLKSDSMLPEEPSVSISSSSSIPLTTTLALAMDPTSNNSPGVNEDQLLSISTSTTLEALPSIQSSSMPSPSVEPEALTSTLTEEPASIATSSLPETEVTETIE